MTIDEQIEDLFGGDEIRSPKFENKIKKALTEAEVIGGLKAVLKVQLLLPFVSDRDKTKYAKGIRDTVDNLKSDLHELAKSL